MTARSHAIIEGEQDIVPAARLPIRIYDGVAKIRIGIFGHRVRPATTGSLFRRGVVASDRFKQGSAS
jgi:hypothetical protein